MNAIIQTEKKSSVVVVEDHPVLCDGLKQLISSQSDLACVGVADDVPDAKRLVQDCKPDLMVIDLRLKAGDALDFIKTLRVECPEVKVLVLSQYDELVFAERALRAGASGYIMKENTTARGAASSAQGPRRRIVFQRPRCRSGSAADLARKTTSLTCWN